MNIINIKKMFAMLIVGIMLLSLVPLAIADDGNETSEDECVEDTDCEEGEFCDSGECEDIEEDECTEDTDCEEGYFCDEDNECEEVEEAECVEDTDCEEGEFCDSGECEDLDELEEEENDAMEEAEEEIAEAEEKIADAEEKIAEREADGKNVTEARELLEQAKDLLQQAIDAFEAGNYEEAEELAEEARDYASEAKEGEHAKEDEDDVKVFKRPHGAEVRLIQLERSIDRNIARGERIVVAILANDENASVDNLSEILEDMGDLIDEIQGLDLENKTPEELAEQYVEIKSRARDLSKQFRDAAREFFTDEDAKALREKLREWKSEHEEKYRLKFEQARNAFNEKHLRSLLERLGIDEDLIEQIMEEADFDKLKGRIVQEFRDLPKNKKVKAVLTFREDKAKADIFKKLTVQNVRYKLGDSEGVWNIRSRERVEYEDGNGSKVEIRTRTQVKSDGKVVVKEQIRTRTMQLVNS